MNQMKPNQKNFKIPIRTIGIASAISGAIALIPQIPLVPAVYANTFSYKGSHEKCLDGAELALMTNGFKDIKIKTKSGHKSAHIFGRNMSRFVSAKIECNEELGTTSFAVAGL